MNVRLLRKIAKVIQEKPKQFDMRWLHTRDHAPAKSNQLDCGTAHCICGWAAAIRKNPDIQNNRIGHDVFGINPMQAQRLFFVGSWPKPFCALYRKYKTPSAKARIAAARIEHFIATKGEE